MLGMTIQKPKRKLSPTHTRFLEVMDEIVNEKKSYTYDELSEAMFGHITDKFRLFYLKAQLSRLLRWIRRRYHLNVYLIGDVLVLLRTKQQFTQIIREHEGKIIGLKKVISNLNSDMHNPAYEQEVKERFERFENYVNKKI